MEPPSKTTRSTSQITGVLQTKLAVALVIGGLSFCTFK